MNKKVAIIVGGFGALAALVLIGAAAYDPRKDPEVVKAASEDALCEAARKEFMKAPRGKGYAEDKRVEELDAAVTRYCHY